MTEAEARGIEAYWGAPGEPPERHGWRLCYRCGEWWPAEPRLWCMPHRLCRACKNDEKRDIWPYLKQWHRKNRWAANGRLLRRCRICRRWRPLVAYYVMTRRDAKDRSRLWYPGADCKRCVLLRLKRGWKPTRIRQHVKEMATP